MVVSNEENIPSPNCPDLEPPPSGDSLGDLLEHLEDYSPTIPDALTSRYLNMAGFEEVDPRIVRIISVTAQKFISDIANDALQHCKTRNISQHSGSHGSNKVRYKTFNRLRFSLMYTYPYLSTFCIFPLFFVIQSSRH